MELIQFKQNKFWLIFSLSLAAICAVYLVWNSFLAVGSINNQIRSIISGILIVSLTGHIILLRKVNQKNQVTDKTATKLTSILTNLEECIVLTDKNGLVSEVVQNTGSEQLLKKHISEFSGINIFNYLGITDEDAKEIKFQLSDGEPLSNRVCTMSYEDSDYDVMVSASSPEEPENCFIFYIRDLDWFRKMQSDILHTERMAGIGRLAADIAHQLNTPLGSILLSSQMLLEENSADEANEDLEKIIRQTKRCKDVVKNLLDLSRKNEDESVDFMLKPLIERTVDLLLLRIRKSNIQVDLELQSNSIVHGKPADLEQALINLINNSIDAMALGGKLSISTTTHREKQAIIYIKDSGKGIDNKIQEIIFDPFFSTKEYGSGTGLGLAISRQIIEDHGGSVEINSIPGKGTMVCVIIPLAMEKAT